MQEETRQKRLRYETELSPFRAYIDAHYHESCETVFRSILSIPPTETDSTPQLKRYINERGEELDLQLTEDDVAEMSEKEKGEFVSERALSVFKSRYKCEVNVTNIVRHIANKYSYEEAETYLKDKRGPFIVELALTEEAGLVEHQYDKKGHKNFLPYDGVFIDRFIVKTYGPLEIHKILKSDKNIEIKDEGDKNSMFWVATIQDLGKPYADLYIDKESKSLFLFVRVTKSTDPQTRYAAISVTPTQISDYINSKRTMADVFSELPFRFASINNRIITFEGDQHLSSSSTFQFNRPFDPLLCVNKAKLKMMLKKMHQSNP